MPDVMPEIEDEIPLPTRASLFPVGLSPDEELQMRARTLQLLDKLKAGSGAPDPAEDREPFQVLDTPTLQTLAQSVAAFSTPLVEDFSVLKHYVTNKLVQEVEIGRDSKSRINALRLLGSIDGVNAYKERSETTVNYRSLDEIEKELRSVLDNVEFKTVGVAKLEKK